ncbi:acyl-CoA synthetase [Iamia sp. SCSIO 61187]|uniref:acyl-CoA synthetase n=1 Tax=Iamia sp. SCSIO 61187 TaxID=2722752 RepID=UPI001C62911B|nr:acyl-CoA synthetase [Iamia sp. SCSIO 61187]QYG94126.1 acyl-CoA synthetase [Iamia sp. SCSIO 61187]
MAFNIADLFERAVDAVGDRTALVVGDDRLSFAQVEERANRLAHHLADAGVGVGDHVGVHGQNSTEWMVAMMAAFKLRAVPININFRYVEDELAYLFDNADLVALVHDVAYAPRVAAVAPKIAHLRHLVAMPGPPDDESRAAATEADVQAALARLGSVSFADALASGSPARDFDERSPDDRYVLYTGGTTGMPKGVVWRHEDVFYALGGGIDAYTQERVTSDAQLAEKAAATETPMVTLSAPPLMHGAAQWSTLRFWFEGGTVVFVPRFTPHGIWEAIAREKVNTVMITGDAMARPMIEALEEDPGRYDLSSLFVVSSSAAVFSPTVKDRYLELLPNALIIDSIGSSEGGMNGMVAVQKGHTEMKGGGPTVDPSRDAVVLDDDLEPVTPGSGVIGRVARGGNIPVGYYKDEAKTAATFVVAADGRRYVVPGDYATVEADGSITLLGRGSVCINSGGEKIFPEEVEAALKAHPDVYDVVVVGVPDERWGSTVAAVVQPRHPGAPPTLDDLDAHCRSRIAGYKVPRQLHLVGEIVRSPAGKPDYPWAQRVAQGARLS